MRKQTIVLWAVITILLAWALLAIAMPNVNRANNSGDTARAMGFMSIPVVGQMIWIGAVALYSRSRRISDPIRGALVGIGVELSVLGVLVLYSAFAHF